MAFVPPVPASSPSAIVEAPEAAPNFYFTHETPRFVLEPPRVPARPTAADAVIAKAEASFQRGKRYYQAGDKERARMQFDRAIDLLFEASANPSDRPTFERKFDEMVDAIHRYDLAGLGSAVVEEPRFEKSPLEDILELTFPVDPKLKNKVKEQVLATQSQLPLSVNDAVLSFINYFNGRGRRTLMAGLERAGHYKPMIRRILDEEGVPQELIHLAQAESGFFPRAVSRMRAAGMWQFVKFRGEQYGLHQTPYVDERLDPEKATRAAARHLHDLYAHFGDWYLAIAGYNCGPGAVEKAVERTGYANFWELRSRRTLPAETANYVPIILALTIMTKNGKAYDLEGVASAPPLEYDVVEMTSPTYLALVADLTETPVSEIQALNPALLKNVAPAGYSLNVPKRTANSLVAALQTIPPERRASWRMHKVENGETLAMIGKRYGASPSVIAAANKLDIDDGPETGDRLLIPKVAAPEHLVAAARKAAPAHHAPTRHATAPTRQASTPTHHATTPTRHAPTHHASTSTNHASTSTNHTTRTRAKGPAKSGTVARRAHKRPVG